MSNKSPERCSPNDRLLANKTERETVSSDALGTRTLSAAHQTIESAAKSETGPSATKNHEVVESALSRTVSPALVAEYQTRLPDKNLLQAKLHEFYELAQEQSAPTALESPEPVTKKRPKKG